MTQVPITLVEYPPLISIPKLIRERGWTENLALKHLGPPDAIAVTHRGGSPLTRVYWLRRVEEVERQPDVIAGLQDAANKRRLREMINDGSIEDLREMLSKELAAVTIDVRPMGNQELCERALAAANASRTARGESPLGCGSEEIPSSWVLSYARRHLVDYVTLHDHFEHRAEPWQVDYLLRERIADAVDQAYPAFRPSHDKTA